jgi:Ca2+-binding EF-hand superfamily protein
MDENAENYDDNATAELLGECIYLASMEAFMTAMTEQMEIDEMLETMPQAGYSMLITTSEWNSDMNMQMDVTIEEIVMADLDTDSVYVKTGISMVPFLISEYTQVQVGELVNVHYSVGGMMAGDGAGMGSYQTRDATPNVMETISSLVSTTDAGDAGDEMGLNLPTGDISDLSSEMPADTEPVITYAGETGVQTMTLEYTNDTGHTTSIVILIDENKDLMSYDISTDNGSASSSISYTVMWGDSVVIEVDDTLPRTSIPINFHIDGMPEDNWDDGDDGDDDWDENDVSWQDYWSGYCEWNGNSGDEETVWWCKESQDDEDWDTWWYYCEHHDSDWHCTDDYGQHEEFENSADGTSYLDTLPPIIDPNPPDDGDDGPPTPDEAMAEVDTDGDGYMSYQEFQDAWDSDPENPELDYDEVTILFDDCDYDDSDLIDIDEMQCFIDGIVDTLPDEGDEDPEQMFGHIDTDDDGYVSLQDIIDFSNEGGDDSDDQIDEEETANWFSWCDTDGDDLLNLDEFTTCVEDDDDDDGDGDDGDDPSADEVFEWMNTDGDGQVTPSEWADFANSTGDIIEEEDFNNLVYMMDMYDYDDSDGLDIYEFAEIWDEINNDGEGEDGDDEPFRVTMMVMGQTLNAPISDFEVRFLFDCGEPDEEGNEPPISNCTVVASNGLTEGSATVDPALTEYVFTYEYLDYDGDGLISDMDTLVIDNLWPDVRVELYDNWADQYTSESFATAEMLPGFGALMVTIGLLGAAMAGRRD